MKKEQKELRKHMRNPDLRNWVMKNDEWLSSNPAALQSLIQNPRMFNVLQASLESRKNKISRRIERAQRRTVSKLHSGTKAVPQAETPKRKSLFPFPKLSLSNLNLENATERISRAAEMVETIRNFAGLLGK